MTVINLPVSICYGLSAVSIPAVSSSKDEEEKDGKAKNVVLLTTVISFAFFVGCFIFAPIIIDILFRSLSNEEKKLAVNLLRFTSPCILLLSLVQTLNSVLIAKGRTYIPLASLSVGVAVKFISAYILISIPAIGIYGAPISTLLCYFTAMMVNFIFMAKYTKCVPGIRRVFLKPFIASALCALSAMGCYYVLKLVLGEGRIITVLSIGFAAVVFFFALFLIGGLTKTDILLLPKGEKIYRLLLKLKVVKE